MYLINQVAPNTKKMSKEIFKLILVLWIKLQTNKRFYNFYSSIRTTVRGICKYKRGVVLFLAIGKLAGQ